MPFSQFSLDLEGLSSSPTQLLGVIEIEWDQEEMGPLKISPHSNRACYTLSWVTFGKHRNEGHISLDCSVPEGVQAIGVVAPKITRDLRKGFGHLRIFRKLFPGEPDLYYFHRPRKK